MDRAKISAAVGVVALLALGAGCAVLLTPFTAVGADGQTIPCSSAVFPNIGEYGALPCMLARGEQALWGWLLFVVGVILLGLSIVRWSKDNDRSARIVTLREFYDGHDTEHYPHRYTQAELESIARNADGE